MRDRFLVPEVFCIREIFNRCGSTRQVLFYVPLSCKNRSRLFLQCYIIVLHLIFVGTLRMENRKCGLTLTLETIRFAGQ